MFFVLLPLFLASGYEAAKLEDKNITIECSFIQMSNCLNMIASLGGNVSAPYAQKNEDLNRTCAENVSPKIAFLSCLSLAPLACQRGGDQLEMDPIINFATKLCKNGSAEQNSFLNSSKCYNQHIQRRKNCVNHHSTSKTDAKHRCCQSKKIQECVKKDMTSVCPKNSTEFQDRLIDTYNSYTNKLCADYNQHCGGAAMHTLSLACLFLALKSIFLTKWQIL